MKKIILILTCIFFVKISIYSQSNEFNHEKYWYYRYKLVNSFLKPGLGNGYSIPAARRAMDGHLHFGDATMDLAWYWSVLATEYRLLQLHNQPTDKTVEELYYALQAFNRLDYYAEVYWSEYCSQGQSGSNFLCDNFNNYSTGSLNGFFIRDDVMDGLGTQSFLGDPNDPNSNFHHFNNFNRIQTNMVTVYNVESDLNINPSSGPQYPIEMTTDQMVFLYMGLVLIDEFVSSSASYTPPQGHPIYSDGTSNIKLIARDITHRITSYVRNNNWQVKNPVNNECIIGVVCQPNQVSSNCFFNSACGSSAQPYAWPFATSANIITNHLPYNLAMPYHDFYSITTGDIEWTFLNSSPFPLGFVDDYFQLLGAITGSMSPIIIGSRAAQRDTEIYPLLRQVLHGGPNLILNSTYKSLINQAPCQGPYNQGNGIVPNYQWSSEHRFRKPNSRGGSPSNYDAGEYNGLDYMLLYNLYSIAQPDEVTSYYFDMRETHFNANLPLPLIPIGSHSIPLHTWAFNTITANNQIASNGNATYRAGEIIYLIPGFHASEGSYFRAYIDNFECEDNDGPYRNTENITDLQAKEIYNSYYTYKPIDNNDLQFEPHLNTLNEITDNQVVVYPNPTNGILITEIKSGQIHYIEIFSSLGNIVIKQKLYQQKNEIDLSKLNEGVYFLKVFDNNMKLVETKKIIKQN